MNQDAAIESPQSWTKVIEPQHSLLQINWKEIWKYRDLIYLLVKRDFTAQYKQTILGPLWFLKKRIIFRSTLGAWQPGRLCFQGNSSSLKS